MAQERGYERQVGPASVGGLPQANAGDFGAGVGQAIEQIGGAVHSANLRAYQIERQQTADSEAAGFNAAFAQAREEADAASIDARNNAAAGGAGHAEAMQAWWDKRAQGLAEGLTDDRVRRSAQAQLTEFGGRLGAAEYQWQEGRRVGKVVTDQKTAIDVAANRARRMHDPKSFAEELSLGRQGIEALQGVPDDVKDQLIREHDQTVSVGFLNGLVDTNPSNVGKVLDSGGFDDILSPEQMERLRNGAEIQIRRTEAAARAETAQRTAAEKDELGALAVDLDAGGGSVDDRARMAARYDAIGDKSKAAEWRGKATSFAAVQGTRDWTLPEMDARIAALTAKQGDGKLTGPEAHELDGLKDQRTASKQRLDQPGGALLQYQYATGRPLAALDPADPASMRDRARQAQAAAQRYGRPAAEPILPTELPAFKDMMDGGVQQRLQALQAIQAFGDPQVIRAAAAQMAGADDGAFRIASQLPLSVARDVLRGEDTLKTAPKVWNEAQAPHQFNEWYGRALNFIGSDYRNDVLKAAKSFYAQRAIEGGEQAYNPGRFAEAIETVIGKMPGPNGATGGIARTANGIVVVPKDMKPDVFLQRFARASEADYKRASSGQVAVWSDNHALTRSEILQLLPTALDSSRYGFRGPNGRLISNSRGGTYAVDVHRLGR